MRRIAIILLQRSDGIWFAHRRLDTKRSYPGLFGLGAGGTIERNEAPEEGARRELLEETELTLKLHPVARFPFEDRAAGIDHEVHLFLARTEEVPRHDASEWSWSGWLDDRQVEELRSRGQLCPDTALAWLRAREAISER